MDDRYKEAILRVCAPVPRPALDAPPLPEFDLGEAEVCPNCQGLNALITEADSIECASCPDCGCQFTPKVESLSRQVIRRISERHSKHVKVISGMIRRNEAIDRVPPAGVDPIDWAAFRVAVDTAGEAGEPEQAPVAPPTSRPSMTKQMPAPRVPVGA